MYFTDIKRLTSFGKVLLIMLAELVLPLFMQGLYTGMSWAFGIQVQFPFSLIIWSSYQKLFPENIWSFINLLVPVVIFAIAFFAYTTLSLSRNSKKYPYLRFFLIMLTTSLTAYAFLQLASIGNILSASRTGLAVPAAYLNWHIFFVLGCLVVVLLGLFNLHKLWRPYFIAGNSLIFHKEPNLLSIVLGTSSSILCLVVFGIGAVQFYQGKEEGMVLAIYGTIVLVLLNFLLRIKWINYSVQEYLQDWLLPTFIASLLVGGMGYFFNNEWLLLALFTFVVMTAVAKDI
ncbi:MAG: hypothetical protein WCI30_00810 [Clostridia bacterium]